MEKKWTKVGAPVPLFDRLTDEHPEVSTETPPFTNYNQEQLINSVIQEATHLLNTRCTVPWSEYKKLNPATMEYPIPDLYGFPDQSYGDASNPDGADRLARLMANSLKLFEPRLSNISVEIKKYDGENQDLYLNIQGHLQIGNVLEMISFPVSIQNFQDIGRREKEAYTGN